MAGVLVCGLAILTDVAGAVAQNYRFEREPGRRALVIGNAAYKHLSRIPSARLDADEAARRLAALRFTVTTVVDLPSVRKFEDEILPAFRSSIEPGDVVVFYFSGHGFTYGPHNFLAPVEMPLVGQDRDLPNLAIAVESVEDYFVSRSPGILLFMIDACRTVGGFVITSRTNPGAVAKGGYTEPQRFHPRSNSLLAFAARPGYVAEGAASSEAMSVFTDSLVRHIARTGSEFGTIFNDISADVRVATQDNQHPGLFDWSDTELYFAPSETVLAAQKELWLATLDSNQRRNVLIYSYRYSISLHAAAARKWLEDHPETTQTPPFTAASPAAVERAWRPVDGRLAITPSVEGFAFERALDARRKGAVDELDNRELGLLASGTSPPAPTSRSVDRNLRALVAHGTAVTTKDYVARTAPSPSAAVAGRVPFGMKIRLHDVADVGAGEKWLAATVPGSDQVFYLPVAPGASAQVPIELGQAIHEVVVRPHASLRDMLTLDSIAAAVARLKSAGQTITWASLAAAPTDDRVEADARAMRLAHATYLLKRAGVDGRRITSVAAADDMSGDGIRIRVFGF
jgi:hypothetical protein